MFSQKSQKAWMPRLLSCERRESKECPFSASYHLEKRRSNSKGFTGAGNPSRPSANSDPCYHCTASQRRARSQIMPTTAPAITTNTPTNNPITKSQSPPVEARRSLKACRSNRAIFFILLLNQIENKSPNRGMAPMMPFTAILRPIRTKTILGSCD